MSDQSYSDSEYSDSPPSFADVTMEVPTWNPYARDIEEHRSDPYATDFEELRAAYKACVEVMSTISEESSSPPEMSDIVSPTAVVTTILKPALVKLPQERKGGHIKFNSYEDVFEISARQSLDTERQSLELSTKWKREKGFWRSFLALCIPLLLSALEGTITNTALPTISDKLNLGTKFSWVATAFLLASTVPQPLYGQLGNIFGRKYPMMAAVLIFAIGSAICGSAKSGAVLIFGRVIQGLGTGGIDLFAEMILCDIIPLRRRGPYLAIKHAVFGVGTCLGPVLGGVLADRHWRWCFYINIPICVVAVFFMYIWLNVGGGINTKEVAIMDELKKVDFVGNFLLTASLISVLVALSMAGAPHPWTHPAILVSLILGLVGVVAFAFFQCSTYCKHPIMPPHVFSNRTTNIAFALTTIHGFVTYGFQFYLPIFFQAVQLSSPTQSGIRVLPTTLPIIVLAAIGGPLLSFWGKYKPIQIIGFSCMVLGFGLCTMLGKDSKTVEWVMFQCIAAAGSGIVISSMLPAVQVDLPDETTGQSSGSWAFLRGTGSLFGVAIPGAIFNLRFSQYCPNIADEKARKQLDHGQAYQRASREYIKKFEDPVQTQIIEGFTQSLKSVWIVLAVVAGIGFVLTWALRQHKMREDLNSEFGLKTSKNVEQNLESERLRDILSSERTLKVTTVEDDIELEEQPTVVFPMEF
jgi:EmrB/QacA subfamily drug resistance transporter